MFTSLNQTRKVLFKLQDKKKTAETGSYEKDEKRDWMKIFIICDVEKHDKVDLIYLE